jgi:solute carrier family 6 amino acid transporter-like protein 5/7/9/14
LDDITGGLGHLVIPLVITLLISWICVFASIVKGIKSSGKLSYVFATLPYVFLITLLVCACRLEGAWSGIKYFIWPESFDKLWSLEVWYNACAQCFFSLTIAQCCVIMFSSYNKFDYNMYR